MSIFSTKNLNAIGGDLQSLGGAVSSLPKNDTTPGEAPGSTDNTSGGFSLEELAHYLKSAGSVLSGLGKDQSTAPSNAPTPVNSQPQVAGMKLPSWLLPVGAGLGALLLVLLLIPHRR